MKSSPTNAKTPASLEHANAIFGGSAAPAEYQAIADNSPVVAQLKANQARADAHTSHQQAPAQRAAAPVAQLRKKKKGKPSVVEAPDVDPAPEAERTDGSQDLIQPKMVRACQLLAGNGLVGSPLANWYVQVVNNGLCGGWAAVHRAAPDELVRIWGLLEEWDPTTGLVGLGRDNAFSVAALLTSAYDTMNDLEPDENYGTTPDAVSDLGPALAESKAQRVANFKVTVPKGGGGGAMILEKLFDHAKVKNTGICFIHIETEKHHISMRTRAANKKVRVLDIVESEKIGVVSGPSEKEAAEVLDAGIYLSLTDFDVDVRIFEERE